MCLNMLQQSHHYNHQHITYYFNIFFLTFWLLSLFVLILYECKWSLCILVYHTYYRFSMYHLSCFHQYFQQFFNILLFKFHPNADFPHYSSNTIAPLKSISGYCLHYRYRNISKSVHNTKEEQNTNTDTKTGDVNEVSPPERISVIYDEISE